MKPFDDYPGGGYAILRTLKGSNARREYGHWLVERGQSSCAYCKVSLVDSYENWLLLTVDHIIPAKEGRRLGIPKRWYESYNNIVLACSGCNGFRNRYQLEDERKDSWKESEFFALRDRVFVERSVLIEEARISEMKFYHDHVMPI